MHDGSGYGGVVWEHFSDRSYSKVVRLANEHCNAFGKNAEIVDKKIGGFLKSEYDEYRFRCEYSMQNSNNVGPSSQPSIPTQKTGTSSPMISLDDAKQKCGSLGFKTDTEAFGTCVLKISR